MKNYMLTLILLLLFWPLHVSAQQQHGTIKESLSLESKILGKEVSFSIYLPPDYDESSRSYPVLYLLHGYSDDETGWTQFGEVKNIMDREVQQTSVTPMIIAMPDAGVSWYINSYDGSVRYEDFMIKEFIPYIEEMFRIRAEKQYRAIAGLSMGGYGSMVLAIKNPGVFAASAPLSAGISTREDILTMSMERWNSIYGNRFGEDLEGRDRLTDHFKKNSVLDIIKNSEPDSLKKVRYYIDCGDDDFLIRGNMELHKVMLDQEIPHEFRVRDGGHTWTYWRTALPEVLTFVSQSFHR